MKYKHNLQDFIVNRKLAFFSIPNVLNKLDNKKQKILCVGEVQSGKTNLIIDMIETAFVDFKYDIVIFFGGTNLRLNNQSYERIHENFDFRKHGVLLKTFDQLYEKGQRVLYIDPKLNHSLESLSETIALMTHIDKYKILIIDDEADFGSINTKKRGESKFYHLIHNIYKSIEMGGLISVTATPYGNLMNTKENFPYDSLFALPSRVNDGYTGISFFQNLKNFYLNLDEFRDSNIMKHFENRPEDYNELCFSIGVYIINSIIKNNAFDDNKSDFLINLTYNAERGEKNHQVLETYVNNILKNFKNHPKRTLILLQNIANEIHKDIVIKQEEINYVLEEISVHKLNGNNKTNGAITNKNIYIGGVLLSRGITYRNLTTELITNFAKKNISIDTLLQMCRWFGYRNDEMAKLCMNVITNNQGIKSLDEALNYNKVFFNEDTFNGSEIDIGSCIEEIRNAEENSFLTRGCLNEKR